MSLNYDKCQLCGKNDGIFSRNLGICPECIDRFPDKAIEISSMVHSRYRTRWNLPPVVPRSSNGKTCKICSNQCSIAPDEIGYCGIWKNQKGKISSILDSNQVLLYTYLDPLPTNCCNMHFCPGGTHSGYPKYSYTNGMEYGYYNLACFLYGCNFSCLGCQNDQHRDIQSAEVETLRNFLHKINKNQHISCICWFGGSPEPQLPFVLRASRLVTQRFTSRILRLCLEWNGAGNEKLVSRATELALKSGGNIKYDLKYFNPNLSKIISGVSNKQSYKNFEKTFDKYYYQRPKNPVLSATTLLIPGYVTTEEVESIAKFLSSLDENIPYSLLVFYPKSLLRDLPITPLKQVKDCLEIAKNYLQNVHLGNEHLLSFYK